MKTERYLARYYHDYTWWSVDIYAYDFADAEARCQKLGLQLDGRHVMSIPVLPGGAWLPNLILRLRNFFWKSE